MKDQTEDSRPRRYHTYTKKMMDRIINTALLDMQFPFMLALLGRDQIVGVFLVYCIKSFFETKESEKIRIQEQTNKYDVVAPVQPESEGNNYE